MNEHVIDRRPIAARTLRPSRMLAGRLASTGVTPNQISLLGMMFGVASGAALGLTSQSPWWRVLFVVGAVLTQLRLLCNMLDGMVALEQRSNSRLGELYNEIPDRVSDSAVLIGFGCALGGNLLLGFSAALLAMFTAYVRAMGKVAGGPQQFCGPMSKPQRMFTVTAAALYCGLAPAGWQPTLTILVPLGLPALALGLICAGAAVASVSRLLRTARALRGAHDVA